MSKYKLDKLFSVEFLKELTNSLGQPVKHQYPNLDRTLKNYQEVYHKSRRNPVRFGFGQFYSTDIPIDDKKYYQIIWSVAAANRVIKKYNVPECVTSLADIISRVDQSSIREHHLPKALKNSKPIFIAEYPQLFQEPKLIIIDGNHRVIANFRNGKTKIPACILSPEQHLEAMAGERFRVLFKVHFNCLIIARYMCDMVSLSKARNILYQL